MTLIALNESGIPIGVANLTSSDMKSRMDLSPWLGGVYVVPTERGKGIAMDLCRRIEDEAKRLGFSTLYLFTKDKQRLYSKLGWKVLSIEQYNGNQVTVMELNLSKLP